MNNNPIFPLKNKKVLLVGLGLLGGGLSTAIWLLKQGVNLTITDLKTSKDLSPTLKKLKKYQRKIKYVLGKHRKKDFLDKDLIVINPAINTLNNPFLDLARKKKIPIENELTLFLKYLAYKKVFPLIIGITGTKGKTTVSNWVYRFLSYKFNTLLALNNPRFPLLSQTKKIKNNQPIILEISSYHLEIINNFAPSIALITNIFPDHLNRYQDIKKYAQIKANIFLSQNPDNFLILNKNNFFTKYFLSLKPKARVFYFSLKPLSLKENGIFVFKDYLYFQKDNSRKKLFSIKSFVEKFGLHNLENLMASIIVSHLLGISFLDIKKLIPSLPSIKFRQEEIFSKKYVKIINDSAATTPEATISAIKRFQKETKNLILITGGTDKDLKFNNLAQIIKKHIKKENLIILDDTGSQKLIQELKKINFDSFFLYPELKKCILKAKSLLKENRNNLILFSPACASFNKFKNEYHRGEIFNKIIKKVFI
ncbi:MAG: UDP-N-acetylmuramoyl-L-alanine--D-glutamate ligase [Minisyncoccia bacterium]